MAESVFVHPTALVESDNVGAGTKVWAFAHIMEGAVVGRDCKIGDHVFIEGGAVVGDRVTIKNSSLIWHGVRISDEVFVGPNVVFTNDPVPRVLHPTTMDDWVETEVGRGASIGANSTILCGIRLGAHCFVGAGSVVTKDVPAHALVYGNPAQIRGWVCVCGRQLGADTRCSQCGRWYAGGENGLTELDGDIL